MPFLDHVISQNSIRFKRSAVSGEAPPTGALRPGEIAINIADGKVFVGDESGNAIAVGPPPHQIVSAGGVGDLTSAQQNLIETGTIVTTTDGRRWVYKGEGGKDDPDSYIELADITPVWDSIPDKPELFPAIAHSHASTDIDSTGAPAGAALVADGEGGASWGSEFDQSLNSSDSVSFNSITLPNTTQITVGTFDNMTGGYGGISLHCAVGYELNWQGGRLRSVAIGDQSATPQVIQIDSPIYLNAGMIPRVQTVAFNTTLELSAGAADIFDVVLENNIYLANPVGAYNGQTIRVRLTQDGNGNRSVSLGDKFVLPSSASNPLPFSTAANKTDILAATYHAGRDKWDIIAFVPGY